MTYDKLATELGIVPSVLLKRIRSLPIDPKPQVGGVVPPFWVEFLRRHADTGDSKILRARYDGGREAWGGPLTPQEAPVGRASAAFTAPGAFQDLWDVLSRRLAKVEGRLDDIMGLSAQVLDMQAGVGELASRTDDRFASLRKEVLDRQESGRDALALAGRLEALAQRCSRIPEMATQLKSIAVRLDRFEAHLDRITAQVAALEERQPDLGDLVALQADVTEAQARNAVKVPVVTPETHRWTTELQADGLYFDVETVEACIRVLAENRGLLLLGAPSTGKTTLARQLLRLGGCTDADRAVVGAGGAERAYVERARHGSREVIRLGPALGVIRDHVRNLSGGPPWIVLDDLFRMDIDCVLAPLWSWLAEVAGAERLVLGADHGLPISVSIPIPPDLRLIATANDNAGLSAFMLDEALLRRFVPVRLRAPGEFVERRLHDHLRAETYRDERVAPTAREQINVALAMLEGVRAAVRAGSAELLQLGSGISVQAVTRLRRLGTSDVADTDRVLRELVAPFLGGAEPAVYEAILQLSDLKAGRFPELAGAVRHRLRSARWTT